MDNWLNDLGTYLQAQSIGTLATNLFRAGEVPANFDPANLAIILTPTGGRPPRNAAATHYPRVQIMCRCRTFQTAWVKALAIYNLLNGKEQLALRSGGVLVANIKALQAPFKAGTDTNQCHLVPCNYEITLAA